MNESNLVGGRLHMYETNGYQNFMIESIVKTFAEYYLRFSESVNKKRWMAFRPSVLTLSFQEPDGPDRRINNIFEKLTSFFDVVVPNIFSVLVNLVYSGALLRFNQQRLFMVCVLALHCCSSYLYKR